MCMSTHDSDPFEILVKRYGKGLSERDRRILFLRAAGWTWERIADSMALTVQAVRDAHADALGGMLRRHMIATVKDRDAYEAMLLKLEGWTNLAVGVTIGRGHEDAADHITRCVEKSIPGMKKAIRQFKSATKTLRMLPIDNEPAGGVLSKQATKIIEEAEKRERSEGKL